MGESPSDVGGGDVLHATAHNDNKAIKLAFIETPLRLCSSHRTRPITNNSGRVFTALSIQNSVANDKHRGKQMKATTPCGRFAAASALLFLFAIPVSAQEDEGGPETWGEDAKYVSITYIQFKSGKREEGMQIIAEHFKTASEKAGLPGPVMAIHFQSGKWDAAFIWDQQGGMADLEWYRSPDEIKWFAALAELNGGVEGAEAIMARWCATIDEAQSEIGHYHTGADE